MYCTHATIYPFLLHKAREVEEEANGKVSPIQQHPSNDTDLFHLLAPTQAKAPPDASP